MTDREILRRLTHRGRLTHICVGKLTNTGSDNGLSPWRRQVIIWTNAAILLNGPLGTNFSEISIENIAFSFQKMHLNMSSGKWPPFCLGLNVSKHCINTLSIFVSLFVAVCDVCRVYYYIKWWYITRCKQWPRLKLCLSNCSVYIMSRNILLTILAIGSIGNSFSNSMSMVRGQLSLNHQ